LAECYSEIRKRSVETDAHMAIFDFSSVSGFPVSSQLVRQLHLALPPTPHVPVADPQDLRCLPPRDLLRHGSQNHILYFHRPLHRGLRVTIHASHGLLPSPPAKRTYHVLSQPDISCATDTFQQPILTPAIFGYSLRRNQPHPPAFRIAVVRLNRSLDSQLHPEEAI
jgi:hypothetical protein